MKTCRAILLSLLCWSVLSVASYADEFGTKEEASALLDRAVAILRVDKNRALNLFTTGDGGFIQKDLYVFCFRGDGTLIAHPNLVGVNIFEVGLTDLEGAPLGESLFDAAGVGEVGSVTYKLPRPTTDSDREYTKTAFVTRVGGHVCGVGYYQP